MQEIRWSERGLGATDVDPPRYRHTGIPLTSIFHFARFHASVEMSMYDAYNSNLQEAGPGRTTDRAGAAPMPKGRRWFSFPNWERSRVFPAGCPAPASNLTSEPLFLRCFSTRDTKQVEIAVTR